MKKILTQNLIALAICLISIIIITINLPQIDEFGYNIISSFISDNLTHIIKFITHFGGTFWFIIISTILLIIIKNKKIGISIVINLILIGGLNQLLKIIIKRPRPSEIRLVEASRYSFPSGHSMVSMAFYGFLIYLIYKKVNNKYLKTFLISILSILIVLVGVSRIYLGVHYTSDVLVRIFNINLLFNYIY